jgi:hypothetical protein
LIFLLQVVVFMRLRLKDTAATVDGLRALLALTDTELSEAPSNRSKLARLGAASLLLDVKRIIKILANFISYE